MEGFRQGQYNRHLPRNPRHTVDKDFGVLRPGYLCVIHERGQRREAEPTRETTETKGSPVERRRVLQWKSIRGKQLWPTYEVYALLK